MALSHLTHINSSSNQSTSVAHLTHLLTFAPTCTFKVTHSNTLSHYTYFPLTYSKVLAQSLTSIPPYLNVTCSRQSPTSLTFFLVQGLIETEYWWGARSGDPRTEQNHGLMMLLVGVGVGEKRSREGLQSLLPTGNGEERTNFVQHGPLILTISLRSHSPPR